MQLFSDDGSIFELTKSLILHISEEMTLNLINRVEHQRKEPPLVSGILKKHYRGKLSDDFFSIS